MFRLNSSVTLSSLWIGILMAFLWFGAGYVSAEFSVSEYQARLDSLFPMPPDLDHLKPPPPNETSVAQADFEHAKYKEKLEYERLSRLSKYSFVNTDGSPETSEFLSLSSSNYFYQSVSNTSFPSSQPSGQPSGIPSSQPSCEPSCTPSSQPSSHPSSQPSNFPSSQPSSQPSLTPSSQPSSQPTSVPSVVPSAVPTLPTSQPSSCPSLEPSSQPSISPTSPTGSPSRSPTGQPSISPQSSPSSHPTQLPSSPSTQPTSVPTAFPTCPTSTPSSTPTARPSQPTCVPTSHPSSQPTILPSSQPSSQPNSAPSVVPSSQPTVVPTTVPSQYPTLSFSGNYVQYSWSVQVDSVVDSVVDVSTLNYSYCSYSTHDRSGTSHMKVCNVRVALSFCLFVVPWSSGRVSECVVKLPARSVSTFSAGDFLLIPSSDSGRYRMNIVIDGQGSRVVSQGRQHFITTSIGNDSIANLTAKALEDHQNTRLLASSDSNVDEMPWDLVRMFKDSLGIVREHPLDIDLHRQLGAPPKFSIPMAQSSISIHNLTLENFGVSEQNGGCLKLYGLNTVNISHCQFVSSFGEFGGAVFVYNTSNVHITSSIFKYNQGINGGALGFFDVNRLQIDMSSFIGNTATNIGGGIVLDSLDYVSITSTNFSSNSAISSFGGGISGVRVYFSYEVKYCYFSGNLANFGSAMSLSSLYSSLIKNNTFSDNQASSAGTIYWFYESGMNEPSDLYFNFYRNNMVGYYGPEYCTEPIRLVPDHEPLWVMNYSSFSFPISVSMILLDFYNNTAPQPRGTMADLYISNRKMVFCSFNSDNSVIVGNVSVPIYSGAATFDRFKISCIPGGYMFVTFTAKLGRVGFDYPMYVQNITTYEAHKFIDRNVKVKFRTCRPGEKYDYFTATRSTCSVCIRGYSFYDNPDRNITTCNPCPGPAKNCVGNRIILYPNTFRWTHYSTSIFDCPLLGGCLGGNATGPNVCAEGFYGPWCGLCMPGFYLSSSAQTCKSCGGSSSRNFSMSDILFMLLTVMAVTIPLALYIFKKYFRTSQDENDEIQKMLDEKAALGAEDPEEDAYQRSIKYQYNQIVKARRASWISRIKITLVTYQIVTQTPTTLRMSFPPYFTNLVKSFSALNVDYVRLLPLSCYYMDFRFIQNMAITTLLPFLLMIALLLMYIFGALSILATNRNRLIRKKKEIQMRMLYFSFFIMVLYFILPTFSNLIFQTFDCVNVDPNNETDLVRKNLLRVDFSVDCDSRVYHNGNLWAKVMVGVYPAGLPILFFFLLYHCRHEIIARNELDEVKFSKGIIPRRKRDDKDAPRNEEERKENDRLVFQRLAQSIGFLYLAYEPRFWFWEIVEITRRLLLTAVLSLMFGGSIAQVTISIALSLIYIKLYNQFKPFLLPSDDALAEMGQYQIFFTFFSASIIRQKSLGNYTSLYLMMDFLLVVVNLAGIALNIYYFYVDYQDGIKLNEQVKRLLSIPKKDRDKNATLDSYYSEENMKKYASGGDEEKEKDNKKKEKGENSIYNGGIHDGNPYETKDQPIKLVKERWKTKFDMNNKEDIKLFIKIVNNMSDDDVFRLQAMIYENIVRYDRQFDEKIWIYCHEPLLLGTLEEIKAGKPRDNALLHAVPLRFKYDDGLSDSDEEGGELTAENLERHKANPKIPIPKYIKYLLDIADEVGFDGSVFKRPPDRPRVEETKDEQSNFDDDYYARVNNTHGPPPSVRDNYYGTPSNMPAIYDNISSDSNEDYDNAIINTRETRKHRTPHSSVPNNSYPSPDNYYNQYGGIPVDVSQSTPFAMNNSFAQAQYGQYYDQTAALSNYTNAPSAHHLDQSVFDVDLDSEEENDVRISPRKGTRHVPSENLPFPAVPGADVNQSYALSSDQLESDTNKVFDPNQYVQSEPLTGEKNIFDVDLDSSDEDSKPIHVRMRNENHSVPVQADSRYPTVVHEEFYSPKREDSQSDVEEINVGRSTKNRRELMKARIRDRETARGYNRDDDDRNESEESDGRHAIVQLRETTEALRHSYQQDLYDNTQLSDSSVEEINAQQLTNRRPSQHRNLSPWHEDPNDLDDYDGGEIRGAHPVPRQSSPNGQNRHHHHHHQQQYQQPHHQDQHHHHHQQQQQQHHQQQQQLHQQSYDHHHHSQHRQEGDQHYSANGLYDTEEIPDMIDNSRSYQRQEHRQHHQHQRQHNPHSHHTHRNSDSRVHFSDDSDR